MKTLINLLLEGIVILILFNVLTMLIPRPIRKGINGTIHLLGIISSLLFKATINITNLVIEQATLSNTHSSKIKHDNVINIQDKKIRKKANL